MPKMTGTELAQVIKNEWPDVPVLLATGYADRALGNDIGLPKVTKPYMQRELAEAIVRMNPPRRKPERVVSLRPRFLVDVDGRYIGFFPPGTPAERMVEVVRPHLAALAQR
jgi:DNA-binding response OmpR family regulator